METRICKVCLRELPETTEYFRVASKHYLSRTCKDCERAAQREHIHKPEVAERRKAYREVYVPPSESLERKRAKNREYMREYSKRPDVVEKRQQNHKIRYAKSEYRERQKELRDAYRKTEDGKAARRAEHMKREALKKSSGDGVSAADILSQYKSQKGRCWWCGKSVGDNYHVDHLIPLTRGGKHSARNIVISCPSCNLSKNNKLPHEWTSRLL
mgnify:FL=1